MHVAIFTVSVRCACCHARGGTVSGEVGSGVIVPVSDKLTSLQLMRSYKQKLQNLGIHVMKMSIQLFMESGLILNPNTTMKSIKLLIISVQYVEEKQGINRQRPISIVLNVVLKWKVMANALLLYMYTLSIM